MKFFIKINKERCKGCKLCISVCPSGVFSISDKFNKYGYHYVEVKNESCIGCKRCVIICPDVAIEIYKKGGNMRLKIGVIPDCFRLPIKEGIKKAAELGLDGIQPYATRGELDPKNLSKTGREDFKHFVESLGLKISALVGDFGGHGFADPKTVEWRIERTKEVIDLAFDLGVNIVTTHIGVVPEDENDIAWKTMEESLPEVGTYAYNKGIFLATETGPEPAILLRKLLDKIGNPGLKVNYDPANLVMVAGDDPVKGVYILKDYIVHTHAKDGIKLPDENGKKRWKELPLGEGNVNWPEYLKAMKEIGYDGFFTIEREVGEKPELDIIHARDFLRKLEKEIYLK